MRPESVIIVYAWVHDSDAERTYGSKTDACAVFRKLLSKGNPPDRWEALLAASARLAKT